MATPWKRENMKTKSALLILMVLCASSLMPSVRAADSQDIIIADFEGDTWGDWKATGDAFSTGPTHADLARKLELENFTGNGVCTTKVNGDGPTGTLTSPPFPIQRKYIAFLISGGRWQHETCMNLLVDGKVVRSATGGNNIHLTPESWDVSAWAGHSGRIEIVDQATGDWGHIDVDDIRQTDHPDRLPAVMQPLYHETLRPQFHFTARQWTIDQLNPSQRQEGWLNDLNGLIYYDGEYHLFAQRWAKCWLHATSKDLVHWTELEPAFWEEHEGSGVQSGHCVVDYNNTSGLGNDKANPPMIAFWSRFDNHSQCISYSIDHGRTWARYEKNPIFDHPERDPKVFWYEPGKHWVMFLYGNGQYQILTSANLLDWKDEQHPIPQCFECPDFFELPVDGNAQNRKWVLIQGSGKYSIGTFDGVQFKEETERLSCDIGPNFYATQTWGNTDTGDGRRIQAAWMRDSTFPEMPFNQQVSFPCELTLRSTPNGPRIFREPIKEIALLHNGQDSWTNRILNANDVLPLEPSGRLFHIRAEVNIPSGATLTFNVRGITVILTSRTIQSGTSPESVLDRIKTVEILVDCTSIETFINQGEISSTRFVLPKENGLSIKAGGGAITIQSLTVYPLNSAWKDGIRN